jgi:hypothetical protein
MLVLLRKQWVFISRLNPFSRGGHLMTHITQSTKLTVPVLIAAVALSFADVQAQSTPPPPPTQVPPLAAAPNLSSGFGQSTPLIQGQVTQYLMNLHGEVDGLLLSDGTQVNFPPHMAKDLVDTVKPDDSVSVQGYRSFGGPVVKAYVITNTRSNQSVIEREPGVLDRPIVPPSVRDWALLERHAEGIVRVLLYGPRGEVNGAVLDDRSIIRVPPHAAYQVASLLQVGLPISAVGFGTENQYGRVIEATAIGSPGEPMTPIGDPGPVGRRR